MTNDTAKNDTAKSGPPVWRNWSGKLSASTATLRHVRSEADAAAVVIDARRQGRNIRVAGAGHSHQPLVPTDGIVVDVSGLSGVISVDEEAHQAWVWAGTPIYALGPALHASGLALANQGDIDRQFIGGAVATGTHGTGRDLANLSSTVIGARIVLASGDVVEVGAADDPDLWQIVRHNLGAVGIVTRLALQLRPSYRLRERGSVETFDDLAPGLDQHVHGARHFEFFWYPTKDTAAVKFIDETDDEPEYPLGDEGTRLRLELRGPAESSNLAPHPRWNTAFPAEAGPDCLSAIRDLLTTEFPTMPWPVEYRTLAADDVWLSTAHDRDTVTISLHQGMEVDDEPMYRAAEAVFRSFDGRPHWGKVNYLGGDEMASIHPRWAEWWAVRDLHDPDEVFLNHYLRSIRP